MNYYYNNIRAEKGDTMSCGLIIEDLGQDNLEIEFNCRASLNDDSELLFSCTLEDGISLVEYDAEKDIRKYAIRVSPEKTKDLQSGTYYYSEKIKVNNDVFTVMKGRIVLEQDCKGGM